MRKTDTKSDLNMYDLRSLFFVLILCKKRDYYNRTYFLFYIKDDMLSFIY